MNSLARRPIRIVLVPLLFAVVATAQEAPGKVPATPPMINLAFPGGTLAEYVAGLRSKEPRANVIVAADAARASLPAIDLRNAGLEQSLQAVTAIAEADFAVSVRTFHGNGETVYSIVAVETPGQVVRANRAQREMAEAQRTQVFSLNRLMDDTKTRSGGIAGFAAKTILSAIDVAIETSAREGANAPLLRFHEDSGLLIVRGTGMQLAIAEDVLASLQRDVEQRQRAAVPPTPPPAAGTDKAPTTR